MPWKNGKGETFEIARFPKTDPYLWRLSMAPVVESGAFSQFSGYDRYLTLVEGEGLKLKGQIVHLGEVFKFSGDEAVSGELIEGKILDLNLIIKRDQVHAIYKVYKISTEPFAFTPHGKISIIFAITEDIEISFGNNVINLAAKETLIIEDFKGELINIIKKESNGFFVFIEMDWNS